MSDPMKDLLKYAKSRDSNRFRLTKTTPVHEIHDETFRAVILEFLRQGGAKAVLAVVLISIVTHRLPIFHLSQPDVRKLLDQFSPETKAIDLRANSSTIWNGFLSEFDKHGHFANRLCPSSDKKPRRPGVYELRHSALLPLVGESTDSLRDEVISVFHRDWTDESQPGSTSNPNVDNGSITQGSNIQYTSEVAHPEHSSSAHSAQLLAITVTKTEVPREPATERTPSYADHIRAVRKLVGNSSASESASSRTKG